MSEERKFKTLYDFIQDCHTLEDEEYAIEAKKFSALERANIVASEYIEVSIYPPNKFDWSNMKMWLNVNGKRYFPIVGWNPDAVHPMAEGIAKVPVMRRWLNRLPKKVIHNSRENRTYILYG